MEADPTKEEPSWLGFYRRAAAYGLFESKLTSPELVTGPEVAADELLQIALSRSPADNISLVVVAAA